MNMNEKSESAFEIKEESLVKYRGEEEVVIIPGGIRSIASRAFSDNHLLKTVVIPEGVECVGSHAFYMCRALEVIVFPKTLKEIEEYAFAGCSSIARIELKENLESLGAYAFQGCVSLKRVRLSASLKRFPKTAFSDYCTVSFDIDKDNPLYPYVRDMIALEEEKKAVKGYAREAYIRKVESASGKDGENAEKAEEKTGSAVKPEEKIKEEKKPKKNSNGWLVFIIICLLGVIGWLVWENYQEQLMGTVRSQAEELLTEVVAKIDAEVETVQEEITEPQPMNETMEFIAFDPQLLDEEKRIVNATAEASSHIVGKSGYEYHAEFCIDNDLTTSWQYHNDPQKEESIKISFDKDYMVEYICYRGGNARNDSKYQENDRPQNVEISLIRKDGKKTDHSIKLEDVNEYQIIRLSNVGNISGIEITVKDVYDGAKYSDTCISEVACYFAEDVTPKEEQ